MPKSRHTSVIVSPSNSRATNRRRSSITELAFHGINTSRPQKAKSVTHVSGTKCHPCLGPLKRSARFKPSNRRNQLQPRPHCSLGIVLVGLRIAEVREDPVAHIFCDEPVETTYRLGDGLVI